MEARQHSAGAAFAERIEARQGAEADSLKRELLGALRRLAPAWEDVALRIHAHPELGRQEHRASAWLGEELERAGFSVRRGLAGLSTSFAASRETSASAPAIAFVAEYDALPDLGHACGHNLIAVAACLAGHALAEALPSRVRVIGAPDEESFGGKAPLLEHGAFDGADVAMMAHGGPYNLPSRDMLGLRFMTLEFHGRSAHAATSAGHGVNALDALLLTFQGVGLLRQQLRERARIDGIVTHGGKAPNLVPDYARAEFCVRARQQAHLDELCGKLLRLARASAEAVGARVEAGSGRHPMLAMRRNAPLEEAYAANLRFCGQEVHVFPADGAIGSTDFGNVSQALPGIHAYFQMVPPEVKHHTPEFAAAARSRAGLDGMRSAAAAMALTGLDLTLRPELLAAVRAAFEAQGRGVS
ncbi:MAG: M20 family metallopeptidase [Planctomycetota bacterium]|nr:M20 family metallopeptidase [Planctomycetota bacterium]